MASFIPALALFILVLSNGCFTLPVDHEKFLNSNQQTTFALQNEHIGLDMSTPFDTSSDNGKREYDDSFSTSTPFMTEQTDNGKREYDDSFSTSTPFMTEEQVNGKREYKDSFPSTTYMTEEQDNGKREYDDSFSTSTPFMTEQADNGKREYKDSFPSTTFMTEEQVNGKREYDDSFSTSTTYPVESVDNGKREFDDVLLLTTAEPTDVDQQGAINNLEGENDQDKLKRQMQVESTTNAMLFFASTSSNVAPHLYTSESSTSTSTGKYTGLLPLENDHREEHEHDHDHEQELEVKPTKSKKVWKKVTPEAEPEQTDKISSENGPEENSKESTPRTAIYDQKALDGVEPNFNGVMFLDDNRTMVVTDIPQVFPTSTKKIEKQEIPLNQGKESLHSEEKE